jgi:hypothetical protein
MFPAFRVRPGAESRPDGRGRSARNLAFEDDIKARAGFFLSKDAGAAEAPAWFMRAVTDA